jgi:hypothetical protein
MSRLNTWLTGEQKSFVSMLDDIINRWPGSKPEHIHLKKAQFNAFRIICKKKEKFPESDAGMLEIQGNKYRGIHIVPLVSK